MALPKVPRWRWIELVILLTVASTVMDILVSEKALLLDILQPYFLYLFLYLSFNYSEGVIHKYSTSSAFSFHQASTATPPVINQLQCWHCADSKCYPKSQNKLKAFHQYYFD